MDWTVVKVGGSLYDWPTLGERLPAWLARLDAQRVLLVPGGGGSADAIRALDRVHRLGEDTSHWLAIRALSLNGQFLRTILACETASRLTDLRMAQGRLHVLDAYPFFQEDENRPGRLPHDWRVTSDSLAVRAAALLHARELVLLKSVDWTGNDWEQGMRSGVVDAFFAEAIKQTQASLRTSIVNLRSWFPAGTCEAGQRAG